MSAIFDEMNSSDDSDDADFVPSGNAYGSSGDEESDNEEIEIKSKKKSSEPESESKVSCSTDEKKRADDLFQDFLKEVSSESTHCSDIAVGQSSSVEKKVSTEKQLFDFAGETVAVPKEMITKSPVVKKPVAKKGLASVLGMIRPNKPKLSVLTKSQLDWQAFKKTEGIEYEIDQFNRGKNAFLDKKRFLDKCDVRTYEIERDIRFKKKKC